MSKVIPGDALGAACRRWDTPPVEGPIPASALRGTAASHAPLTARHIEQVQQQAYDEGFALGHKEGLLAGKQEIRAQAERLEQVLTSLARPLHELDQQAEQELVNLALAVAKQLIRREIKTDPGQIVAAAREALAALPAAARNVRLHLHPEDAARVREALALSEGEHGWRIVEDPVLTRGGCRVVTDTSYIDARVESRINAIVAQVLGDERESGG